MSKTPLPESIAIVAVDGIGHTSVGWRVRPKHNDILHTAEQLHAHAAAVSAADNAALQTSLADSRAYVERLKSRIDEVVAYNAALRAELEEWRFTNKVDELERHVTRQAERIKFLENALRVYLDVYENVPDAIDKHGEWYQTEEAKLADAAARAALGDKRHNAAIKPRRQASA